MKEFKKKFKKEMNKLMKNKLIVFLLILMILVIVFNLVYFFLHNKNNNNNINNNEIIEEEENKEDSNNVVGFYFKDKNFYRLVLDAYNKENNKNKKVLTASELASIETVGDIKNLSKNKISNLTGLEKLTNLKELHINITSEVGKIDLSNNIKLENITIDNSNSINDKEVSVDTSKLINLKKVHFINTGIDLRNNINLEEADLCIDYDPNLTNNVNLKKLSLAIYSSYKENFPNLNYDLSKNTKLEELSFTTSRIGELDLTNNLNLKSLSFDLTSISNNVKLNSNNSITDFHMWGSDFEKINIKDMPKLEVLSLTRLPDVKKLDLSPFSNLKTIFFEKIGITSLDLSKNDKLEDATVHAYLNSLNLGNKPNLKRLDLSLTKLDSLDLSKAPLLEELIFNNELSNSSLKNFNLGNKPNLKRLLLSSTKIDNIDLSKYPLLEELAIERETRLKELDLSKNDKLEYITVSAYLSSFNLGNKPNLKRLDLSWTKLDSLDLSKAPLLEDLIIDNEKSLKDIDLSNNKNLKNKNIK